jgi:cellulose synthase/poly-beta-1,6-N-acetylglucosamine synthase-like glycosyltransferase
MFTSMLAFLIGGDFILLALSILIFEIPRYTISLIIIWLGGLTRPQKVHGSPLFSVSAIIPCFNDAADLTDTVNSLWALRHEGINEIIVINDGSTDQISEVVAPLKIEGKITTIINHPRRQGRSAGVNHGARFAKGDLIIVVDSDSFVRNESIMRMQRYFNDSNVAGVSGTILAKNSSYSLVTALQSLEYLISITAGKTFLDVIGSVGCLSGAFSMYRKSYFLDLGGMDPGGGEDLELTLRMRRCGYDVRFEPEAISETRVPADFLSLVSQRIRWDGDAYWLRVIQYKEMALIQRGESLSDTLRRLDFILFEIINTLIFPVYIVYISCIFDQDTIYFFLGIYFLTAIIYFINISIALAVVPHSLGLFEGMAVFVLPLYQGIVMKFVRFYAFSAEILWKESKNNDYTPSHVRSALHQF